MFLVFQSKRTLCYLIWAKRGKNAGLLMLETFCLATDSGLSLCLSKDSLIRLSKNGALLHCKEEEEKKKYAKYRNLRNVFGSEKYFGFVDAKCFRDYLVKLRLGLLPLISSTFNSVSQ